MRKNNEFSDIKNMLTEMLEESTNEKQSSPAPNESSGNSSKDKEQIDMDFSIKEIMDDREIQIRDALKRIDESCYGICLDCGKEIVRERLEAMPETTHCIDCRKKKERQAESMINLRDTFFPDQIN